MSLEDPRDLFSLTGRVAVVTGASSGLGRSFAAALAGAGARVVLAARRQEQLLQLAQGIEADGGEALAAACDVSQEADVEQLVGDTLERFGRIDVLVNNAGITRVVPVERDTAEGFEQVMDINLRGVFLCCQRVGRVMLENSTGSIINVASVFGLVAAGQIPQASYAASKGAVVSMTREIAAQWARRGVRVNAIAPGWFESEMTGDMFQDKRSMSWLRARTPMGRAGRHEELVGALVFLASDASSFVTGQTLAVDGGWTIV